MLGRQSIVEIDRQVALLSELHPELLMALRATRDPSAAMKIDQYGKWPRALRYGNISSESGAKFDVFMEGADFRRDRIKRLAVALDKLAQRGDVLCRLPRTLFNALQDFRFCRHRYFSCQSAYQFSIRDVDRSFNVSFTPMRKNSADRSIGTRHNPMNRRRRSAGSPAHPPD